MSGGRWNYMDSTLKNEMFEYSRSGDKLPNIFEDRELSELTYDLFNLMHDLDWYLSGDTCKDTYLESKAAFKKKWLGNRGQRIKRTVDAAIEDCKRELYETYGLKED